MTRTIAAAVLLSVTMLALPAYADDSPAAGAAPITVSASTRITAPLSRPAVLPVLYASYGALQVFDIYSTRQALARGGNEANPLMQGAVGNTARFAAVKVVAAAGAIVAAERLWKKNRTAAIAAMVASNSVAAIVAARNARTLRQLQ